MVSVSADPLIQKATYITTHGQPQGHLECTCNLIMLVLMWPKASPWSPCQSDCSLKPMCTEILELLLVFLRKWGLEGGRKVVELCSTGHSVRKASPTVYWLNMAGLFPQSLTSRIYVKCSILLTKMVVALWACVLIRTTWEISLSQSFLSHHRCCPNLSWARHTYCPPLIWVKIKKHMSMTHQARASQAWECGNGGGELG